MFAITVGSGAGKLGGAIHETVFPFCGLRGHAHRAVDRRADSNAWTSLGPDGGIVRAIAIDPQGSNILYAATNAGVSKATDGGTSWNPANSGLPTLLVSNIMIDTQHPDTLYLSSTVGIFKSADAGASWNSANNGLPGYGPGNYVYVSTLTISLQDSNTLYACLAELESGAPSVFKSTDGGPTGRR